MRLQCSASCTGTKMKSLENRSTSCGWAAWAEGCTASWRGPDFRRLDFHRATQTTKPAAHAQLAHLSASSACTAVSSIPPCSTHLGPLLDLLVVEQRPRHAVTLRPTLLLHHSLHLRSHLAACAGQEQCREQGSRLGRPPHRSVGSTVESAAKRSAATARHTARHTGSSASPRSPSFSVSFLKKKVLKK